MGLDTSHGCWNGPYTSFNRFRHALAEQIGIDLDDYIGYGGNGFKELSSIDHDLRPLFDHSDCDGTIEPHDALMIVDGLNSILDKFKKDGFINGKLAYVHFEESIKRFRDGCALAANNNETIEFH